MRYIAMNTISHTYPTVRPSAQNHQVTTSVTSVTSNTVKTLLTLHIATHVTSLFVVCETWFSQ